MFKKFTLIFSVFLISCLEVSAMQTELVRYDQRSNPQNRNVIRRTPELNRLKAINKSISDLEVDDGDPMTIKVKFRYPENLRPQYILYGNCFWGDAVTWDGSDEIDFPITRHSYYGDILIASFEPTAPDEPSWNRYFVFKEFDTLTDGMEVTFDASEATNEYILNFLNQEGKPLVKNRVVVNDGEVSEIDGDVRGLLGQIIFFDSKHCTQIAGIDFQAESDYTDEENPRLTYPTVYLNKLPENCGLVANAVAPGNDRSCWYLQTTLAEAPGVYSNDYRQFAETTLKTSVTPYSENFDNMYNRFCGITTTIDGLYISSVSAGIEYIDVENECVNVPLKVCIPEVSGNGIDNLQSYGSLYLTENESDQDIQTATQLFNAVDNKIVYRPQNIVIGGTSDYGGNTYSIAIDNSIFPDMKRMINPHLAIPVNMFDCGIANCVPTMTAQGIWTPLSGNISEEDIELVLDAGYIIGGYCGRQNETIKVDMNTVNITGHKSNDTYNYVLTNDNVMIDYVTPGRNITELKCHWDVDDWCPPVVQYLRFLNKDGIITDRFENISDAELGFYAGDFELKLSDDFMNSEFVVKEIKTVKVEYAHSDSDNYNEIEAVENPDMFFMPGYGYYYQANFESVTDALPGWYNLRITLIDETGNSMIQTLSPAFHVEKQSGMEALETTDKDTAADVWYNLQGIRLDGRPTAPGIYIRNGRKTAVR